MRSRTRSGAQAVVGVLASLVVLAGACTTSDEEADGSGDDGAIPADGSTTTAEATEPPGTGTCDDTDPAMCLLPWPSDRYTRADAATRTGRRLDLPADEMPANSGGTTVDPTEWNRNDGFSPVSTLLTVIEDLDVEASDLPPVTDIGASLAEDSALVLVDVETGERVAAWAELDANATDPARQALLVIPATALVEGHRHAVGLRNLVRTGGTEVEPSPEFAALVDEPGDDAEWLDALAEAGAPPEGLDLGWSFTVGSSESISGRLRHMADETMAEVGDGAPPFEVTSSNDEGGATVVRGSFEMPRYLQGDGGPGTYLDNDDDPDGIPSRNGTMDADFVCTLPTGAEADDPSATVIYGHGLLGSRDEVLGIGSVAATVGFTFCALDWIGMSSADIPPVLESLGDLTSFRALPDRLQQGHLGFLLLGRLLRSDDGLATDPAFQSGDGRPVIDTTATSFLGASQGGILGGVPSALTNDWDRAVLAVPGMSYNLLLRRSTNFDQFAPPFEEAYPDQLDQVLLLDLIQQLWQRGENAGYAQHLTEDPYDGTEDTTVMLLAAFGDHQVANVSTENLARTLGIGRKSPTLADGRSADDQPFFAIPEIESLPHDGSGLVMWDFDTPAPPTGNTPPRDGEDPHGKLADVPEALALVAAFLAVDGQLIDVCGGQPCRTEP
ncbi:hypothetical protein BH20ACT3_BH20ACT3_05010 [soil metagenome]